MLVIYLVLMAETTGTWFAVSHVVAEPLTEEKINRGVIGEGLGCLVSSFIGGTPVTSYSTNAGIISITGVASRKVFVAACVVCLIWLIWKTFHLDFGHSGTSYRRRFCGCLRHHFCKWNESHE